MKPPFLIFDLDGTLTDPREGIFKCIAHTLAVHGRKVPSESEMGRFVGPPLAETFRELVPEDGDAAVRIFRERYSAEGLYQNRVYEGIEPLLALLRSRGTTLFIATSKPVDYATRIVDHFGLDQYFTSVYGSEMSGERANKSDLLRYVLSCERLPPDSTIMVGDRRHDIIAAHANSMRAIGVTWGFGSLEELQDAEADMICRSPEDLEQALFLFDGDGCAS